MQLLRKLQNSDLETLKYSKAGNRTSIKLGLIDEQYGFCAYSERFIKQTDSVHIEHFYPKAEYSNKEDDYMNWYAVLAWMNEHKPKKIKPFLPILEPSSKDILDRIKYFDGIFNPKKSTDIEAENLISFLGINKIEVRNDRFKHVQRVKKLKEMCSDDEEFLEMLFDDWDNLSFITALETEFKFDLMSLIKQKIPKK